MEYNILSLFDGISCGRNALEKTGIKINKYYASEIDKYAISISKYNYNDIIQLGDINHWREWDVDWSSIDILLGGFPCQSWSIAGNQQGDKDERGKLLWVMLDVLNHIKTVNPDIKFLFENVKMKKEFLDYINKAIGVNGYEINSNLVSAQNRKRLYWTNILGISQPYDKKIYLKDVLENNVDEKYNLSDKIIKGFNNKSGNFQGKFNPIKESDFDKSKSYCLTARYYKMGITDPYISYNKPVRIGYIGNAGQGERIYTIDGKSVTLSALGGGRGAKTGLYQDYVKIRKLTPIECERLQTLPYNYTAKGINSKGKIVDISNTQRYKCIGNGWTVDIIAHILKGLSK